MNQDTMELFRTLTEMPAAPGFEHDLRRFVKSELTKYADEIVQDRMGGVYGVKRGNDSGPVVMVTGHMDEVAFIVTAITDKGMLKFQPLGGWWNQVLLAQRMQVITPNGPIVGVVGSTPPHLLDEATRAKPIDIPHMYLDIGADDREEAERLGVKPGLSIVPICPFTPMANPKKIMAKAWDNRYGVGLAIELLKEVHKEKLPNVLYAGATVQEEMGLRGAEAAANLIKPDLFFGLDASPANDMSGDKNAFGQLGKGALLRIFDRTMVTNPGMIEFVRDIASTHKIPYQYYVSAGGTDAGRVHTSGIGVPSTIIGICSRYIHSAASIIHSDDYAAAKELVVRLVRAADRSALQTILGE